MGVLVLYCLSFLLSLLGFAAMGRRGTVGSLFLAVFTVGLIMTSIHYALAKRGW